VSTRLDRRPDDDRTKMTRMSRRSLLWSLIYFGGIYGALRWLNKSPMEGDVIAPLRKGLQFNEKVWERLYSANRRVPTYNASQVTPERLNETIGMDEELDRKGWRLILEGVHGADKPIYLTMKDILAMPSFEMTTEFFCIEGWSVIQKWKGVAMREFMKRYPPLTKSGQSPDLINAPQDLVPYVLITTPSGGYYVGLDMPSAIHEQTMLCYEMNGKPLTEEHGAPLRLVIPVKYGIKNLKRIGKIKFTTELPKDYWAEQGYDWYAGL
jgi:DMSO/TMAO reductase YedYZ molybdopterin-dependent catalytic subunit